jgi:hypothetical protein
MQITGLRVNLGQCGTDLGVLALALSKELSPLDPIGAT